MSPSMPSRSYHSSGGPATLTLENLLPTNAGGATTAAKSKNKSPGHHLLCSNSCQKLSHGLEVDSMIGEYSPQKDSQPGCYHPNSLSFLMFQGSVNQSSFSSDGDVLSAAVAAVVETDTSLDDIADNDKKPELLKQDALSQTLSSLYEIFPDIVWESDTSSTDTDIEDSSFDLVGGSLSSSTEEEGCIETKNGLTENRYVPGENGERVVPEDVKHANDRSRDRTLAVPPEDVPVGQGTAEMSFQDEEILTSSPHMVRSKCLYFGLVDMRHAAPVSLLLERYCAPAKQF